MLLILITGPQAAGKTVAAMQLKDALESFRPKAVIEILDDQYRQPPAPWADATIIVAQQKPDWIDHYPEHLHFQMP